MFMQAIHAETEQSVEKEVERLIFDRILNHDRKIVLSTTDRFGIENAYETMIEKPKLDVNIGEQEAYFNNYKTVGEDLEFGKNTARFAASEDLFDVGLVDVTVKVAINCIKCDLGICIWIC